MRAARAGDFWRNVYSKKDYGAQIHVLKYNDIVSLGSGEVDFHGAITAICGGNGVGKSTLIDAAFVAISPSKAEGRSVSATRLRGSTLLAELKTTDSELIVKTVFDDMFDDNGVMTSEESENIPVRLVDPSFESTHHIKYFAETKNLDELLEGLSPHQSSDDELKKLSYLVGKKYVKCDVYEIEEFDDENPTPYFVVQTEDSTYASENMGQGELSLFLMYWHLRSVPEQSILLLEEPETHLSPRSQKAILNVIAECCTRRSIWTIITTHSATVVSEVPDAHVRLLYRDGNNTRVETSPNEVLLSSVLGMPSRRIGVILVEDRAAKEFTLAMLRRFAPHIVQQFEVFNAGSNSGVTQALEKFPKVGDWLKILGLLDGDQRSEDGITGEANWPIEFLPGDTPPEIELRSSVDGKGEKLSELLKRDTAEVNIVLSTITGADHHDWYHELAAMLTLDYSNLMNALFDVWVDVDENMTKAEACCKSIQAILFPAVV